MGQPVRASVVCLLAVANLGLQPSAGRAQTSDFPEEGLPVCESVPPHPPVVAPEPPVSGPVALQHAGQLGGRVEAVARHGDRLFAGIGRRIATLDISEPRRPRVIAQSSPLPSEIEGLAARKGILAAAAGDAGLFVLDIGGGTAVPMGSVGLPGYAESVALRGEHALVADGPAGVRIVDISVPAAPFEVGSALDFHQVFDVAVARDRAYVAAADEGLVVLDIADLAEPKELGETYTGGYALGVDVRGSVALVADGWDGVRTVDVSDPSAPRTLAKKRTNAWAVDVVVRRSRAFVAAGADGLLVLDISDPTRPKKLDRLAMTTGHAASLALRRGLAYVSDIFRGIHVVRVGKPRRLKRVRVLSPLGPAQSVAVRDGHAYVAAVEFGLRVVDVSDPTNPREVRRRRTQGHALQVIDIEDRIFFVTIPPPDRGGGSGAIFGADVSDPTRPSVAEGHVITGHAGHRTFPEEEATGAGKGDIFAGATRALSAQGEIMYYAGEWGLFIMNGSTLDVCEIGFLQTQPGTLDNQTIGVSPRGSIAYLGVETDPEGGLYVVDISDPTAPELIRKVTVGDPGTPGAGHTLAVGETLFVLNLDQLHAFDIGDPTNPVHLAALRLPAEYESGAPTTTPMVYAGGRLFVADGGAGVVAVDVSDPATLAIAGRLRVPGRADSIASDGRHVYATSRTGGLSIIGWPEGPASSTRSVATSRSLGRSSIATIGSGSLRCTVTTTEDAGPGSLRRCLTRTAPDGSITFSSSAFPPENPATIHVGSLLPGPAPGVTIDGTGRGIVLDGGGIIPQGLGAGDRNTIRGLQIQNFLDAGIGVSGARNRIEGNVLSGNENRGIAIFHNRNRVVGNFIGTDPTGSGPAGEQVFGITIAGRRNVIGGRRSSERNVISGHETDINVSDSSFRTRVIGNYIGTDVSGSRLLRPGITSNGLIVDAGARATVVADNVIGGHVGVADGGTYYNSIIGNHIGVDVTGTKPLGCTCAVGTNQPFNRIGGSEPGERNLIAFIISSSTDDNVVLGNVIGATIDGVQIANANPGIRFFRGSRHNIIGGRSQGGPNVIAGSDGVALDDASEANVVLGNFIGVNREGQTYEIGTGISIAGSGNNLVFANSIAGAQSACVTLHLGAFLNIIRGNLLEGCATGIHASGPGGPFPDQAQSFDNLIFLNSFQSNVNATDEGTNNRWDDGSVGNFWSDYAGSDADGDGIGDTPHPVPPNGTDGFPLMTPLLE